MRFSQKLDLEKGERSMDAVLLEKEGPIGLLTLNRPEKRNALSLEVISEMLVRLEEVAQNPEIRIVILRGEGSVFSAGHDIREMSSHNKDLPYLHRIFATCNQMMLRLQKLPRCGGSLRQPGVSWWRPATLPLRSQGLVLQRRVLKSACFVPLPWCPWFE
jgi:hypothetical protein